MPLKLSQEEPPTINLTSMIDILFLLIIFFMVGTRFVDSETKIKLSMPKVASNGAMLPGPSGKTVYVHSDGTLELDGNRVSLDQLTGLLAQAVSNYPDITVQIKPDRFATMEQVGEAAGAVNRSGAKTDGIAFATSQMSNAKR
jgi:biopolymer transport protein ExbD